MAITSKAISDLVSAITSDSEDRKSNTYSAIVSRVDNEGVIWVRVAGSDKETPTASTSAEVKANDNVNVEWRNNKLYIAGNVSNPSVGAVRVTAVEQATAIANQAAQNAVADAGVARQAAEEAQAQAVSAQDFADAAQTSADNAAEQVELAKASAEEAAKEAISATKSANAATYHLSEIERVVDALSWMAEHATYKLTQDTEPTEGKWYFAYESGNYVLVTPHSNPYNEGLYELDEIDTGVSNYISTHLWLDDLGLHVRMDDSGAELLITSGGISILGSNGQPVAQYTDSVILGDANASHIELSSDYGLAFYQSAKIEENGAPTNRVAYLQDDRLFIRNARLTDSLQIGNFRWVVLEHRISLKYDPVQ